MSNVSSPLPDMPAFIMGCDMRINDLQKSGYLLQYFIVCVSENKEISLYTQSLGMMYLPN